MTVKNTIRLIALVALTGASNAGVANAAERSPIVPLYEKIWAGKDATKLPDDIVDPKILHARLVSEGPSDKWKDKIEAPVGLAIAKIKFATVLGKSIKCSATVCETMILLKAPQIVDGVNIGEHMTHFITDNMGPIVSANGAETSSVIAGGNAPDEHGLLVYTFWK